MTIKDYNLCVDEYADSVYRFILKNVKSKDEAKDVVQDAFEKMWINKDNIDGKKTKSYLFSTAYHTMIDKIRKNKKQQLTDTIPDYEVHENNYSDLQELLHQALDTLPDIQKSVILLRDYEGYSYEEISEITNLTESQVKVYIYRGRVALKKYIGKVEYVV